MGIGNGAGPGGVRSRWGSLRSAEDSAVPADTIQRLLSRSLENPAAGPRGDGIPFGAADRASLANIWTAGGLAELESLSRESDPSVFWEGMLELGRRRLSRSPQLALQIFETVGREAGGVAPSVARRALEERDAVIGQGSTGRRLEYLGRHFAEEAANPAMLAGMTLAGTVFQISRTALLSRFVGSAAPSLLTRGLGARLLASGGAFALEAPTFVLGVRGANAALGREQDWSGSALARDLASSFAVLGALKLAGGGASLLTRNSGGLVRGLVHQTATFGGILAGHRLEEIVGLAPHRENGTLFVDALATLAQFHVGGRLSGGLLGENFRRSQAVLEFRASELGRNRARPAGDNGLFNFGWAGEPALAAEGIGGRPAKSTLESRLRPHILLMEGKDGEGGAAPSDPPPSVSGSSSESPLSQRRVFQVVEEISQIRSRLESEGKLDVMSQDILREKAANENLDPALVDRLRWGVTYREIYDRSRILREQISQLDLSEPSRLMKRLREVGSALKNELSGKQVAISTLVQALAFGGRIPLEKVRSFVTWVTSYDLLRSSRVLRERIGPTDWGDTVTFIRKVRTLRRLVKRELGTDYSTSTLIMALAHRRGFPREKEQTFLYAAAGADVVDALPLGKLRLQPDQLRDLTRDQVFIRLLKLRTIFPKHREGSTSIGQVLQGLRIRGLERVKDGEIDEAVVGNAFVLQKLVERWPQWGSHFSFLSTIAPNNRLLGWSRIVYAREYFRKSDGASYADPTLSQYVRWGVFLYEHREALGLGDPLPISPRVLASSSARAGLVEYFKEHPLGEDVVEIESLILNLLGARADYLEAAELAPGAEAPSLRTAASAYYESLGREAERSTIVFAASVDMVMQRWAEWAPLMRVLARLPKHNRLFSRTEFAASHLRQADGGTFSDSALQNFIRWGALLWQHREAFGLPEGGPLPAGIALPPDLAVHEFLERRGTEMRLPERKARWSRSGSEEVLSALLRFRPELETEIQADPDFRDSFAGGVAVRRMVAAYLRGRGETNPPLERDAGIVDALLARWNEWQAHFRLLNLIPDEGRGVYTERHFPDYPKGTGRHGFRWGTWLWRNREDFRLAPLPPEASPLEPFLIELVGEEIKGLRIPRRIFRPSREHVVQVADAMLRLRSRLAEQMPPPVIFPEGQNLSFADLYEWSTYFTGRSLPTFREAMATVDEMLRDWHFWSLHASRLHGLSETEGIRYLRPAFPDVAGEKISRFLMLRPWIQRHERELFLRSAPD